MKCTWHCRRNKLKSLGYWGTFLLILLFLFGDWIKFKIGFVVLPVESNSYFPFFLSMVPLRVCKPKGKHDFSYITLSNNAQQHLKDKEWRQTDTKRRIENVDRRGSLLFYASLRIKKVNQLSKNNASQCTVCPNKCMFWGTPNILINCPKSMVYKMSCNTVHWHCSPEVSGQWSMFLYFCCQPKHVFDILLTGKFYLSR